MVMPPPVWPGGGHLFVPEFPVLRLHSSSSDTAMFCAISLRMVSFWGERQERQKLYFRIVALTGELTHRVTIGADTPLPELQTELLR